MNDVASPERSAPVASAPLGDVRDALVERWWNDCFPGSPVASLTAAWNHAFAAKEELKRRLASLKEEN